MFIKRNEELHIYKRIYIYITNVYNFAKTIVVIVLIVIIVIRVVRLLIVVVIVIIYNACRGIRG